MYVMKSTREALLAQEKTIVTGDCCYLNPLIRRIIRFIGKIAVKPCIYIGATHVNGTSLQPRCSFSEVNDQKSIAD